MRVVGEHEAFDLPVAMLASAKSARRRHLRPKIENQTSIKLNQDACTGRNVTRMSAADGRPPSSPPQPTRCELTGSRIRWIGCPVASAGRARPAVRPKLARTGLRRTMPHTWPSLTRNPPAGHGAVALVLETRAALADPALAPTRQGAGRCRRLANAKARLSPHRTAPVGGG